MEFFLKAEAEINGKLHVIGAKVRTEDMKEARIIAVELVDAMRLQELAVNPPEKWDATTFDGVEQK